MSPAIALILALALAQPVPPGGGGAAGLKLGNVGTTANAKAATLVSGTLKLQPASSTLPGVVTAGTQTFGGVKSFTDDIVPLVDEGINLGSTSKRYGYMFASGIKDNSGTLRIGAGGSSGNTYKDAGGSGASNIAHTFDTVNTYSAGFLAGWKTAGGTANLRIDYQGRIAGAWTTPQLIDMNYGGNGIRFSTGSSVGGEFAFADKDLTAYVRIDVHGLNLQTIATEGKILLNYTDGSGSPGDAVINRVSGRAAIAALASSAVITNSTVDSASIVACHLETGAVGVSAVLCAPGSGSFTATAVNGTGVATATTGAATFSFVVLDN